jgi:hypothetical protein
MSFGWTFTGSDVLMVPLMIWLWEFGIWNLVLGDGENYLLVASYFAPPLDGV